MLLGLINLFSTSHYEWMLESGDIDNLCQLPLDGRYTTNLYFWQFPVFFCYF
ncbi:hypothetical protein [Gilliamella mensalis]|uniref:hypothetical protein n=1 Tax=Gilliamella mensalis TaxID=1908520 RepID=UPI0035215A06